MVGKRKETPTQKEKRLAKRRADYQVNKGDILEKNRLYRLKNHEKIKAWQRDYYKRNKEMWLKQRAGRYKLTVEEFKNLGSVCRICGEINKLHIDHDHITNKVRGILCSNCNGGLGFFKDNILIFLDVL